VPAVYVPRAGNAPPVTTPTGTPFFFDTALNSDFFFWAATRFANRALIGSILGTPPEVVDSATPQEQMRVQDILESILPVQPRRFGLMNDAAVVSTLTQYELKDIRAPTLVISVEDDRYGTYASGRYTADRIRNARFVGYPSGGHLWVGHQDEILSEVSQFLTARAQ
jgi:pimeloyl-ACP methyl ester carboxylesterase